MSDLAPARRASGAPRRILLSILAFVVAWSATSGAWLVWTAVTLDMDRPGGWEGPLLYVFFIGGFAALGWGTVVVPLVAFVRPHAWICRPATAWLVGAAFGTAILLVELAIFFQESPGDTIEALGDPGVQLFLALAAGFGAVLWTTYCLLARRSPGAGGGG